MEKQCTVCNKVKPLSEFYIRADTGKPRCYCKACHGEKARHRWKSDPIFREKGLARAVAHRREKLYGVTEEKMLHMLESQSYECAICKSPIDMSCHIDHDHSTGEVRGLLCPPCNKGLGHFKDDISNMEKAIDYLKTRDF